MTHLFIRFSFIAAMFLGSVQAAWGDSFDAVVDRTNISLNETLNLRLVYEGKQSNSDPDYTALAQQFDVLSNQKSMQHSIINGTVSASTEWRLILAPKNTGQLLIPPFSFNGQKSKPLVITVTQPSQDPTTGKEDVFLETFVDKSSAYVQEQVVITFRLYYNRSVDSLDAAQLNIENARVESLPRVDYQKAIGQTQYGVAEFKYAVFADASGTIDIPAQTWTVRTTDQPSMSRFGFNGGRYKLHRVKTKALSINIEAKPDAYPVNAVWLPAQQVTLDEQWSQPPETFKVGEPITRTVTLHAEGAAAEQLAPIFSGEGTQDFKFYPDKPKQENQLLENGLVGQREESIAIVPAHGGQLTLPAVEVTWWNTESKQVEVAKLPARTVNVEGALPQMTAPTEPAPQSQPIQNTGFTPQATPSTPWFWIILSSLLLFTNIITLLWLNRRVKKQRSTAQASPQVIPSNKLFSAVSSACVAKNPQSTRAAILSWSKQRWGHRANTLAKLGQLSGNNELCLQLKTLDAVLFAGAPDTVDYSKLSAQLEDLQKHNQKAATHQLQPLYASY